MADFSKISKKKLRRFGEPPQIEQASNNLIQPEHAPAFPEPHSHLPIKKLIKKTTRTVPFGLKVTESFSKEFKKVAVEDGLKMVELLEISLEAYKSLKLYKQLEK